MNTHSRLQAARENAFEAANRAKKVLALCEAVPWGKTETEVERTASFFEHLTDAEWKVLAAHVGIREPSATTRAAVCHVLRSRKPMLTAEVAQ